MSRRHSISLDTFDHHLQWRPERTQSRRKSTILSDLTQRLSRPQIINVISSQHSIYVDTWFSKKGRVCFHNLEGRKAKTDRRTWISAKVDYGSELVDCFMHNSASTGYCYYTWQVLPA